jgi:hypothetical protein
MKCIHAVIHPGPFNWLTRGTFVGSVTITIQAPQGLHNVAKMYYTMDNQVPTLESNEYTGPFTLTVGPNEAAKKIHIKVIAYIIAAPYYGDIAVRDFIVLPPIENACKLYPCSHDASGNQVIDLPLPNETAAIKALPDQFRRPEHWEEQIVDEKEKAAFENADINGDKTLSFNEWEQAFGEGHEVFDEADINKDETVSWDEFVDAIEKADTPVEEEPPSAVPVEISVPDVQDEDAHPVVGFEHESRGEAVVKVPPGNSGEVIFFTLDGSDPVPGSDVTFECGVNKDMLEEHVEQMHKFLYDDDDPVRKPEMVPWDEIVEINTAQKVARVCM